MEKYRNPNIVSFGLQYRRIVLLISCVLIAWGIYSLVKMDKNEFPSFTIREGVVAAVYPGADATQMEQEVLKPLQDYVFSYKEVNKKKTTAQCSDGMVMIFVTLDDNVDKVTSDHFWDEFKLGVDNVKATLPAGVLAVRTISNFGNTSALLLTMQGKDKTYRELHDYMEQLRDRLRAVPSIGTMTVYGEQTEQVSIRINTERLSHYGIDEKTLAASMLAQGFQTTGGRLKSSAYTMPLYVAESFNSVNDIRQTVIFSTPDGQVVRVGDIADVVREYPDPTSYITNNGDKCLLLSIEMKDGENIVAMGNAAGKVIDEFADDMPVDMELFKITDQPTVVNLSVIDFLRELLIAIVAVLVVIMVLLPLKVAIIAALTIPVTIFISLGLFYAFGIELNTVTLACLIVSLGMIVDNSVVIIDEYVGLISEGVPHKQATINAGTMFFRAIVSATAAISITFFPFLITMTGMFRDFLTDFPWAILMILTISLIVAELLVPYLQFKMIKKPIYAIEKQQVESGKKKFSFFISLQKWYDKLVALCFAWPKTTIVIGVLSVVFGTWLFLSRPIQLMPIAERDQFAVEIYLPEGSSLDATDAIADSLARILRKDDRVVSVASFHGMSSPRFQTTYAPQVGGPNYAQFIVNTKSNEATIELLNEYTPRYQDYFPGAYVKFKQLSYSNSKYPIEVRFAGLDYLQNMQAADSALSVMRRIPGITLVRPQAGSQLVAATVEPDDARMSRLGVNNGLLELTLAMRYGAGVPVGTLWEGDYGVSVVAMTQNSDSASYGALLREPIPVLGLGSAQLKSFADVKPTWHPGQINYRGGIPTAIISADNVRGLNTLEQTDIVRDSLAKIDFPEGVSVSYGGDFEQAEEMIPQMLSALMIAVVITFFILLFHYKGVTVPTLMLVSLLFIIPGAGIGLALMDAVISLTCTLGLISLMGILVRNVIIMFDYAEELQDKGLSVKESIYQASERRMRPIFLTSAAATMGVLPMVLTGSALWKPMGIVIFFGTPVTMVFILTVIPILYSIFCRKASPTIEPPVDPVEIVPATASSSTPNPTTNDDDK
ncbi:MAG: efflux RND transporter permease subunit [Candidatus Amulumruptor caecigallinarius]|nr:efflux RND transporter permease subunit [Candidatus Amulumruptor caecigallinarius]MCM1397483.1 efflux RND transporter permease subunit [Candidatus Amulumruptor caecigallinarius]MCM1454385.1 efflux RND transporter permease subunit [bacterium]